jgi:hypothetical protein
MAILTMFIDFKYTLCFALGHVFSLAGEELPPLQSMEKMLEFGPTIDSHKFTKHMEDVCCHRWVACHTPMNLWICDCPRADGS